ncbi:MAG: hypothetical protein KC502_10065 [Myxococcales bacterium]|nr:hypothetical protein [Myxococcales bacterium]
MNAPLFAPTGAPTTHRRSPLGRLVALLLLTTLAACGGDEPAASKTDAGTATNDVVATEDGTTESDSSKESDSGTTTDDTTTTADAGSAKDTATTPDSGTTPDAGSTPDSATTPDAGSTPDSATTPDAGSTPDSATTPDAGSTPDSGTTPDAGSTIAGDGATLVIDDQVLSSAFNTITVKSAALPAKDLANGKLKFYAFKDGKKGASVGVLTVVPQKTYTDQTVVLSVFVVSQQTFIAEFIKGDGKPYVGADGTPHTVKFQVTGDITEPQLTVNSQMMDPSDLYTIKIAHVIVPDRFTVGAWVAVYADVDGKPGALLGKKKFVKGEHKDTEFKFTSKLIKGQILHAILRKGADKTGSWTSKGAVINDLAGLPVTTTFKADSTAFHPVLEIEDQVLTNPKEIKIKKVVIPKEHWAGWLALYADKDGKAGALLGKLYYTTGTKTNKIVKVLPQQGKKTIHAVLYAGQKWDVNKNVVMVAPGGGEMTTSFKIGAASLSYITAKPYTTKNPRHVVVTRAYSYDKPAWVVLARDDNGKPGTIIAQKKVAKKFAGNVHFTTHTHDFLTNGSSWDYLIGKPGTFRRCARGIDKLHVMLYEDFPQDSKFTYKPGGTEDLPVLDANKKPVHEIFTVTVKAAIQNSQKWSSRYYWPCPLSQHVYNSTALPVDCRCHANVVSLDFPECRTTIADALGMQFGDGPRARTQNFGGFYSGFTVPGSKEIITLVKWKDHKTKWPENKTTIDVGVVMAIDVETRKRRIVGGRFNFPKTGIKDIGTGPVLSYPFQVQIGPSGKYYIANYSYVRIGASLVPGVDVIEMDPKTGNRKYVWRSNHLGFNFDKKKNPYGHCGNGRTEKFGYWSVQIGRKAFGIDKQGNFYFSYAHNSKTAWSNGVGILKVSADGKKCDIVTSTGVGKDNFIYKSNVGTGPIPQAGPYRGMLLKDGKIYTSTGLTSDLYEIDVATGNRKLLHKKGVTDNNSGSSGTHVTWDPYRKLIWQAGLSGSTLLYDPAKGTTEPLWCPQNVRDYKGIACLHKGAWGYNAMPMERGMWMHPTDKDYMFVVNLNLIARVHLPSGTSEIFSY